MPRTRIIATIGPASSSRAMLRKMFAAGLDAVRFNFSHGDKASILSGAGVVRDLNKASRRRVRLLADLKGNRIRIGELKAPLLLEKRREVILSAGEGERPGRIPFDYKGDMFRIKKGHLVYIDDGNICLAVRSVSRTALRCEVAVPGLLKPRKGVNIPLARLDFPLINPEDKADLDFALANDFDYIAQSFVRTGADVMAVVKAVRAAGSAARVIAKIEAREALENIDEIIGLADGIMVARGDMGVAFPVWQIPVIQKRLILKCNRLKKPVITATQMLESMTEHKTPTRAEVSDVANAILDGSDYVMLSGETATGLYPAETVRMMNEIIKYTEANASFL